MRRGTSDHSLVVGIDKPVGKSSHDVVDSVRRIFDERRVGHAGTLDPLASGVLPVLVGPAARLSDYLMGHDKVYRVDIAFGSGTTTDDAEGDVIRTAPIPAELCEPEFAASHLRTIIGKQKQMPPAYSAIKVNGKRAYAQARSGHVIELESRPIEIYSADLLDVRSSGAADVIWTVRLHVSKGTYIRSIARDLGFALNCPAHVSALRRISVGVLGIEDCVHLETLAEVRARAALDPVLLLGYPVGFPTERARKAVENGNKLRQGDLELFDYPLATSGAGHRLCACTSGLHPHCEPPSDGMLVSVVADNALKGIYAYAAADGMWKPQCVFSKGVSRGLFL